MDEKLLEDLIFALTYVQHGGSGLTWTRADVLEMTYHAAVAGIDRLQDARRRDAEAMKKAARRKH